MRYTPLSVWLLAQEARALLTRLARVKPFSLFETSVPAAAVSPAALTAIEFSLARGRRVLRAMAQRYLRWLDSDDGYRASPAEAQRRYSYLRLRFNAVLSQFDIFADVFTQRSEHETGVWLAGLDAVATDALALPGDYYKPPPVICYLDRGQGAAIRRAHTRLPGGGQNPVAVIRVPRERMIGSGIASSLIHEVGHQGSALLGLVDSIRPVLKGMQQNGGKEQLAWQLWDRWISEILADFWAVARVGIAGSLGLMGVVSLPRAFVFRAALDDPHPIPWIRVKLSCALGQALFPHPQWQRLARLWESYYPRQGLTEEMCDLLALLQSTMPGFVGLLVNHRPRSLHGHALGEVLSVPERQPERLMQHYETWRNAPDRVRAASPSLAFAAIGQARANGMLTPEVESRLVARLLSYWALKNNLELPTPRLPRSVARELARAI